MSLHDPNVVRAEYATEAGLLARRAAYEHATGPNAPEMVFEAVAEVAPRHRLVAVTNYTDQLLDGPLTVRRSPVIFIATR